MPANQMSRPVSTHWALNAAGLDPDTGVRPGKTLSGAPTAKQDAVRGKLPARDRQGGELQGIPGPNVGRYAASDTPSAGGVRKLRNRCTETPESSK